MNPIEMMSKQFNSILKKENKILAKYWDLLYNG